MLFNSLQFLVFFPVVTFLYFVVPHRFRWPLLLAASCYFYMVLIPIYILILLGTILVDYAAGILIEQSNAKRKKLWLYASIIVNVGCLGVFKYYNFFVDNYIILSNLVGFEHVIPYLKIVLPVGLSFHTFQAMSYTIEVYRGNQKAERHLGIYALYVMFYPQLVAGPIERPQNLLPQFHAEHKFDLGEFKAGLRQMLWGFFKKLVVADRAAQIVNVVYASPSQFSACSLGLASALFAFQIYADFSGYSDIAIGAAKAMGFRLMQNFNHPYFSRSVSEFWNRWHISLSTWFRDYLYFTLGGNRGGWARWQLNLMITFVVSGFWHGANWTFVIWGLLNGLFLVVANIFGVGRNRVVALRDRGGNGLLHACFVFVQMLGTFILIDLTWVFFRAEKVSDAWLILSKMAIDMNGLLDLTLALTELAASGVTLFQVYVSLLSVVCLLLIEALSEWWKPGQGIEGFPMFTRWSLYYAMIASILYLGVFSGGQFFYFQF